MPFLLHETLVETARRAPDATLLVHDKFGVVNATTLLGQVRALAGQLQAAGVGPNDRIGVFLPKLPATVSALYATSMTGAAFVPINPVLKSPQVEHILNDCDVKVLITSSQRLAQIAGAVAGSPRLEQILVVDEPAADAGPQVSYVDSSAVASSFESPRRIDNDMAAILYTSGSTGRPKGVVVSHRNVVTGAESVAQYLGITSADRLLAVLPFSFDYGLNQLTSAVLRGATCVLFDYLFPRDVIKAVARHAITGLAAVPPLWTQLAPLEWPHDARTSLRYITNSGGALPKPIIERLRKSLPNTELFLMYGLTEAFRSTYLPPSQLDARPGSMGRAIPNAEILVVNADGNIAGPGEHGELVHRGALVAMGYWNDPERTAERFKPAPNPLDGLPLPELAVWSGDTVYKDADGFLYFVGRNDGMLKTSGYRVSADEIEEFVYRAAPSIELVAAVGIPDEQIGQAIVLVVQNDTGAGFDGDALLAACRKELPNYMVPRHVVACAEMPYNQNGKIDRPRLTEMMTAEFEPAPTATSDHG